MKGGITLFITNQKRFKAKVICKQNRVIAKKMNLELATTLGMAPHKSMLTLKHEGVPLIPSWHQVACCPKGPHVLRARHD